MNNQGAVDPAGSVFKKKHGPPPRESWPSEGLDTQVTGIEHRKDRASYIRNLSSVALRLQANFSSGAAVEFSSQAWLH